MISGDLLQVGVNNRLKARLINYEVIAGGITWGQPAQRPLPPYGWIGEMSERKKTDTNTSRLRVLPWSLHLMLNNPIDELSSVLARQVSDALTFAPLVLPNGASLVLNEDPAVRWLEEDYYWHVTMDFLATVRQATPTYPVI